MHNIKDFFISYRGKDRAWAEWIAWQLEEDGYSVIIQAWDFRPGSSFVDQMDKASKETKCTIAVLSPDYFDSSYTTVEWQAAYRRNPRGEKGLLVPVCARPCEVEGLLGTIVYIDLVGLDESTARERLLMGVRRDDDDHPRRVKPSTAPDFPSQIQHSVIEPQKFPGDVPEIWNVPFRQNPFFTGREDILNRLHEVLTADRTVTLTQAISGLGGIGKTQTAQVQLLLTVLKSSKWGSKKERCSSSAVLSLFHLEPRLPKLAIQTKLQPKKSQLKWMAFL